MDTRVIPAWAGNRGIPGQYQREFPGHPRVGGEQANRSTILNATTGSSPRGRGTARLARQRRAGHRVIPAWAGNRPR